MRTLKKEGVVHFNIYCDHCDRGISGIRYKCIQCEDYDLCSECEASGAHPKHYMIRMPRPLEWSSYHGRRLLHHMKKFFKRDGTYLSNDGILDKRPVRENRCRWAPIPNFNLSPWLDAFAPFFFNFNENRCTAF